MDLHELNALDRDAFVARLGAIYEHSPWVAQDAWAARPFESMDALYAAMQRVMLAAPRETQLGLIRAHPDLRGSIVRAHPELRGRIADPAELTEASRKEQAGAGLNRCSAEERARLQSLNRAYREKFGFPFIVAVRGMDAARILGSMETRLARAPEQEFRTCLEEIGRIARFRLEALFGV